MRFKALGIPLAIAAAVGLGTGLISIASAQQPSSTTYRAQLAPVPLNGATASGQYTLVLTGNQAVITGQASGLADTFMNMPYPHVQHIHGGANGVCPDASADSNRDGVLNTTEGQPAYGPIQTTLSVSGDTTPAAGTNIQTAPTGGSFNYTRTIALDAATMASLTSGKAVIVVHGLDPATAPPAAASSPSELVPSLPLAATSPALCGVLTAASSPQSPAATSPQGTAPTATAMAPRPAATLAPGTTMRPPNTGDGGLASQGSDSWTIWGAAFVVILGFTGATTVAFVRARSR